MSGLRNSILNSFLFKTFFQRLVLFFVVIFLVHGPLHQLVIVFNDVDPVLCILNFAYEINSGDGSSMYVYCLVYYQVIVASYVRNVGCVFALLYTLLVDNSECLRKMS